MLDIFNTLPKILHECLNQKCFIFITIVTWEMRWQKISRTRCLDVLLLLYRRIITNIFVDILFVEGTYIVRFCDVVGPSVRPDIELLRDILYTVP